MYHNQELPERSFESQINELETILESQRHFKVNYEEVNLVDRDTLFNFVLKYLECKKKKWDIWTGQVWKMYSPSLAQPSPRFSNVHIYRLTSVGLYDSCLNHEASPGVGGLKQVMVLKPWAFSSDLPSISEPCPGNLIHPFSKCPWCNGGPYSLFTQELSLSLLCGIRLRVKFSFKKCVQAKLVFKNCFYFPQLKNKE